MDKTFCGFANDEECTEAINSIKEDVFSAIKHIYTEYKSGVKLNLSVEKHDDKWLLLIVVNADRCDINADIVTGFAALDQNGIDDLFKTGGKLLEIIVEDMETTMAKGKKPSNFLN